MSSVSGEKKRQQNIRKDYSLYSKGSRTHSVLASSTPFCCGSGCRGVGALLFAVALDVGGSDTFSLFTWVRNQIFCVCCSRNISPFVFEVDLARIHKLISQNVRRRNLNLVSS